MGVEHEGISEQLIQQLPDGVFVVDGAGTIVYANAQAEILFGWDSGELLGRSIETLVPANARAAHPGHRARYLQDPQVRAMGEGLDLFGCRKDGTQFPAEISLSAIETEDGRLVTAVVRDATHRMRTQAKFQGLLEAAPDAMLGVDGSGLIQLVNTQAERMFGWSRGELLGRPIETLVPDQVRERHRRHRQGYFLEPQVRAMGAGNDLSGRRKDGSEFPAEISLSSIETEDGLLVTAAVRDVTERKAFEGVVARARDVAEAAAQSRQEFLANMSHEIRTPMNAIIGMTSLLLDMPMDSQQRDFVETVRTSGEHLLTIINDILDYAKIDAGKLVLEELPFSVRDWLQETLELVTVQAREKGLELLHDVDPDVPEVVLGDPARLRQIVVNLLSNAVKFTHSGEVCVRVGTQGSGPGHDTLQIVVTDTGIGIAADRIDLLFEPFTQADSTTTRLYGGTGLGLAISRRLAGEMGGSMTMESTPGQGTTVGLVLSVRRRESPSPPVSASLAEHRVLVIADNPTERQILQGWASRAGMGNVGAGSATAALDVLDADQDFSFVVVDLDASGMDSLELARILRARFPRMRVILLACGGVRSEHDHPDAFNAILTKPVRQERLFDLMASLQRIGRAPEPTTRPTSSAFDMPESARRLSILIVEDTAVNQKVAQHLLARFGFRSDVAASGSEALSALGQRAYDLILMDVQMPEMDGLEATRRIRSSWPGRPVQIIAMTANVAPEDVRRCYESGMDGFLPKPIEVESLARVLHSLVTAPVAPAADSGADALDPPELVDRATVSELCDQIGEEAVREIADLFFADVEVAVPELQNGCREHDRSALATTAHRLKSSARSLGAQPLGELLHQLEEQAPEAEWPALAELVGRVIRQRGGVHDQLLAELAAES